MPKSKSKRNLNKKNPVKKKTPQSPSQKPLKHQEKPQKPQWTNKPKRFHPNQPRLLKLKLLFQRKLKSQKLLQKKVNKKLQRKS
jgi:hypothetical protein